MAGKNIKQLINRTIPSLNDFLYLVAGTNDYNITLGQVKSLFGIDDIDQWVSATLADNDTSYIDLVDSTEYGAVRLEYLMKRGSRNYRAGIIDCVLKGSSVIISDVLDVIDSGADDLGVSFTAQLSSGLIQLLAQVDNSDANEAVFNYRIISKKPITIS